MSTATITGTIQYPVALGGPNTSLYLGSPTINSTSTTGPQTTYNEGGVQTLVVTSIAPVTIPLGTIGSASLLYIGASNPITLKLNGSTDEIEIAANGFILLSAVTVSAAIVQAVSTQATVTLAIFGD
jgi:hypothetical protein